MFPFPFINVQWKSNSMKCISLLLLPARAIVNKKVFWSNHQLKNITAKAAKAINFFYIADLNYWIIKRLISQLRAVAGVCTIKKLVFPLKSYMQYFLLNINRIVWMTTINVLFLDWEWCFISFIHLIFFKSKLRSRV